LVHKGKAETRAQVAFSSVAKYMLDSIHYHRFRIVGWPADLDLPDSVNRVDAISLPGPVKSKPRLHAIQHWYSYRLLYSMYAGVIFGKSRVLIQFEKLLPYGEYQPCLHLLLYLCYILEKKQIKASPSGFGLVFNHRGEIKLTAKEVRHLADAPPNSLRMCNIL
jgi:hypothetical protein